MEDNIKPSVVSTVNEMLKQIKKTGLSESMIIDLLQKKTKLPKRDIKKCLDAIIQLEREILQNRAKYNKN